MLYPRFDPITTLVGKKVKERMLQYRSCLFDSASAEDLRFHDLRHGATSRFFERTTMSEGKIMKITGHSSTRMLMRYASLRGSNLAKELW
jgi:integrase